MEFKNYRYLVTYVTDSGLLTSLVVDHQCLLPTVITSLDDLHSRLLSVSIVEDCISDSSL